MSLARGKGFSLDAVTCVDDHRGWSPPEVGQRHRIVLVRRGTFRRMADGRPVAIDPTMAYVGTPGEEERFSHPAGGDVCTSLSLSPDLWRTLAGDDTPLTRSTVYVDARFELAHRRLLATARDGDPDFALVESLLPLIAATLTQLTPSPTPATPSHPRMAQPTPPPPLPPPPSPSTPSAPTPSTRTPSAPSSSAPSAAAPSASAGSVPAHVAVGRSASAGSTRATFGPMASVSSTAAGSASAHPAVGRSAGSVVSLSTSACAESAPSASGPVVSAAGGAAGARDLSAGGAEAEGSTPGSGEGSASGLGRAGLAVVDVAREVILAGHPAAAGLVSLAELLAVSPFQLSRAFTRELGVSLTHYRNRVRVSRALERLEGGEPSLAVLSADLGFADQAHLTRTIRRHLGHTPTAVRRLLATRDP